MVSFGLCYRAGPVYKRQGCLEIGKTECLGDVVLIDDLPVRNLTRQFRQFLAF